MGQAGGAAHIMASLAGDTMEVVWYGAKTHETLKRGPFDFAASSSGQAVRLTSAQLYVFGTNLECGVGQVGRKGTCFSRVVPRLIFFTAPFSTLQPCCMIYQGP